MTLVRCCEELVLEVHGLILLMLAVKTPLT
jgi:hypothetical protein